MLLTYWFRYRERKNTHAENVNKLFDQMNHLVQDQSTREWLASVQHHAIQRRTRWKKDIDAFIQGLIASKHITEEVAASCRNDLHKCFGTRSGVKDFSGFSIIVAVASLAAVLVRSPPTANMLLFILLLGTTIIVCMLIARHRPWADIQNDPQLSPWGRRALILCGSLFATIIVLYIPLFIGLGVQFLSTKEFKSEMASFTADPKGFPLITNFARTYYNTKIVLNNGDTSITAPSVSLPNAMLPSMSLGAGFCRLTFEPLAKPQRRA